MLIKCLCIINIFTFFSELKDNMANDTIEGEVPELLKAILAKDPNVFKAGASTGYVDQTGKFIGLD